MSIPQEKIMELEDAIKTLPNQINLDDETKHFFADGVYLRWLRIPADVVITGKIHRTRHLTIVASGTCQITTGEGMEEITGPYVFVSPAGTKKAIYAVTDVVLMNPHPTEETDLDIIEDEFIAPSFEALEHNTEVLT